ncbi:MAG: NAD-dependent epimerase/dehydratase family protein [Dehalococcoidia bacterium]
MKKKPGTVLVTGGRGFIGSHLADRLVNAGYPVALVDINIYDNPKQKAGLVWYNANINNPSIEKVFRSCTPEVLFHLAGPIYLRQPIMSQKFTISLGFLEGLMNLLIAALNHGTKKVVLISSGGAIYGDAGLIPTPEDCPPQPNSLYGLANLMMESVSHQFCSHNQIEWQILRLGNLYGPRQWKDGIIPSLATSLLNGIAPIINGDGRQTRDFLYIGDAIDAFMLTMNKNINGIFNLSSGIEIPINAVFGELVKLIQVNIRPLYQPNAAAGTRRSCLDSSRFRRDFGWEPKIGMEEGLIKTIAWYRKNS